MAMDDDDDVDGDDDADDDDAILNNAVTHAAANLFGGKGFTQL